MRGFYIFIGLLVSSLAILGVIFPVYFIGVIISNIALFASLFDTILTISLFAIGIGVFFFITSEFEPDEAKIFKRVLTFFASIALFAIIIRPFIPENKETAMMLIGAQIVYDSDTAKDIAKSSSDILKRSVNVFSLKLRDYEKSLVDMNVTK